MCEKNESVPTVVHKWGRGEKLGVFTGFAFEVETIMKE